MSNEQTQLPPGIFEAIQASQRGTKPPMRTFSTFENGTADLIKEDAGIKWNKYRLLCPRAECRSTILSEDIATFHDGQSVQMEPQDLPAHSLLPVMPPSSETTSWWLVEPSPMQFDNIGFSKAVTGLPLSPNGKRLKLLTCADCELGPLGWCEEGGTKFYVACSRVGYRYESKE
ncbi:Mss4-like protein [Cylindrobasidium torrendii FP15055 ss-10]|uniref:Mss4-like protein n=1 Tax=Cylindrobasidium torrendii FP15055 ss-10 TaxID=1314674 RepID=A0A0D7BRS5_9AGAR|nr:Mss4-like protein [Cylindrobasidium torrendii FP15055 ss-10]